MILRCIVRGKYSYKKKDIGATRLGKNVNINGWCCKSLSFLKTCQLSKSIFFLKTKKNLAFFLMTLAYFSGYSHKKYSAKMHVCRNHTIASFTTLAKKKKNQ